jgi:hypothetical protein
MTTNDGIQARVNEFLAESASKAGVTVDRIVRERAKIAFSDVRSALDWGMKQTDQGSIQYVTPKDSTPHRDCTTDIADAARYMATAAREIAPPVKETKPPPAGISLPNLTMDQFMDLEDEGSLREERV